MTTTLSPTLWHCCDPQRHATECTETLTVTRERPRPGANQLLVEFHPPSGKGENATGEVPTKEALRWPHVVSCS